MSEEITVGQYVGLLAHINVTTEPETDDRPERAHYQPNFFLFGERNYTLDHLKERLARSYLGKLSPSEFGALLLAKIEDLELRLLALQVVDDK